MRLWHRWLAIVTTIPFGIIVITGVLLQIKTWLPALQPISQKSSHGNMSQMPSLIAWENLLKATQTVPAVQVEKWEDIKTIDVRPALGVARVRTRTGYEVQIDLASGKILSAEKRYTSFLIELHEGAAFGSLLRNFVFVPTGFLLILVLISGVFLLVTHYRRRWHGFKNSK